MDSWGPCRSCGFRFKQTQINMEAWKKSTLPSDEGF